MCKIRIIVFVNIVSVNKLKQIFCMGNTLKAARWIERVAVQAVDCGALIDSRRYSTFGLSPACVQNSLYKFPALFYRYRFAIACPVIESLIISCENAYYSVRKNILSLGK